MAVTNLDVVAQLFRSDLSERLAEALVAQLGDAACPTRRAHDVAVEEESLHSVEVLPQLGNDCKIVHGLPEKIKGAGGRGA